jgi:tetratricopeptide (TPR) repeat protein
MTQANIDVVQGAILDAGKKQNCPIILPSITCRTMNTISPSDFEHQIDNLLGLAGREICSEPSAEAFVTWFCRTVPKVMPALLEKIDPAPEEVGKFLRAAALNLFADLPQPAHDLQRISQPKPGRNEPCSCGSGKKYKHCCGEMVMPPLFGNMNLLRYVLDAYPKRRLGEVVSSKASVEEVADTARQWNEFGEDTRVVALLEPYFAGSGPLAHRLSPLFDVLMDSWLTLGKPGKRDRLLGELVMRGDRPLKSDALQRHTTMLADQGNYVAAWLCFKQASELNPNDPALSFLEVTTLLSEGRTAEAQTRALWWADFLARQRDPQLDSVIEVLRKMAKDPHGGMMNVAGSANADLQRLHALFLAAPQPAVHHSFEVFPQDDGQRGTQLLASDFEPDAELEQLEQRWSDVFQQGKPSMTTVQNGAEEVWDNASDWLDLLEKHPALWCSFDVLDDLVMAADTVHWAGVQQRLLVPLAERAAEQLRLTLESGEGGPVQCPWGVHSHRIALRPVAHLAFVCAETGNWQRFMELAHWLVLELNPDDNHGLRDGLSGAYVRFGRWDDVLALSARYPDDLPTLTLNAVLATFALGDHTEAAKLLKLAQETYPAAVKMLLEKAPKPVKPDGGGGVLVGGKYEAWLYVGMMREFWEQQQALEWARASLKTARTKSM